MSELTHPSEQHVQLPFLEACRLSPLELSRRPHCCFPPFHPTILEARVPPGQEVTDAPCPPSRGRAIVVGPPCLKCPYPERFVEEISATDIEKKVELGTMQFLARRGDRPPTLERCPEDS